MSTCKIEIECDVIFARHIKELHKVYQRKMKCGVNIDFSGANDGGKFKYHNIDADTLYEIVMHEAEKEMEVLK